MMKKLFVMLSLVLCLGMFGCFSNNEQVEPVVEETEIVAEETEAIEADTLCVDEVEAEVEEAEQVME